MTGRRPVLLLDTSAAVALVVADHSAHDAVAHAVADHRLGLAGHAAFETYSVLTRLPPPARRAPATIGQLLAHNFPATRHLGPEDTARLLSDLPSLGIAGGAVYDALVGAVAAKHELPLLSRDERVRDLYRSLGVETRIVS